ncbi:hypothetical protein ACKWTF_011360 [Chironomus riparius]
MEYDCDARVVFFEVPEFSLKFREKTLANSLEEMKSPRLMKSHLPVQLLPDEVWIKKPTLLFINRDAKDVAISHYHLLNSFSPTQFTLEDYLEDFLADSVMYSPYREYIQNYLNLNDYQNILYLTYEEMSADLNETIQKVSQFFGKTVSDENVDRIKDYLKFENMKNRKTNDNKFAHKMWMQSIDPNSENHINFIRKGIVGGYRDELPEGYADRIDNWYAERIKFNRGFSCED